MPKLFKLRSVLFLAYLLLGLSCSSNSGEDYRAEGEAITLEITAALKKVHTRADLLVASSELKQLFNELVDVMIAANEYRERHPEAELIDLTPQNHLYSDQLRAELNRIFRIDGSLELLEKCQEPALHRLDAYEKRLAKRHKR